MSPAEQHEAQANIQSLVAIANEVYSGVGVECETDSDRLFAMANWLDRIDNVTDAMLMRQGNPHRVERLMQEFLRKLSQRLEVDEANL
jgi:hypothetical protein